MNNLIEKYSDILNYLNDLKDNSSDNNLKKFAKKSLIEFINGIYRIEKSNKESYQKLLENFNLDKNMLLNLDEKTNKNLFDKYEKELESIFNNPNEESIKVWLKNIIDYSEKNNINEKDLNSFILEKFKLYDKNENYINKVNTYIDEIKNKNDNLNNTKNNIKEDSDNVKKNNLFKSDNIEENKTKENINEKEQSEKDDNKENKLDNKPLKIKNMKKSFNSKIKNKALTLTALTGLGVLVYKPLYGIAIGVCGYLLYKNGVKSADKLIEKYGYCIDKNDNLVDKTGKIITNEDIGKLKYNLIREELNKMKEGKINKEYKKNRLTSLLLNNKLVKTLGEKFKTLKEDIYESPQLVKDINKGMRNV